VKTIVVDCVPIVDPQLASIIRDDTVLIPASPEKSHASCPTDCKVISSVEARPITTCVPVVHIMFPASHLRPVTGKMLAATALTTVERVLPEQAMAVSDGKRSTY
jgi:hypothetical protein